jgi:hypothetical protein
MKLKLGLLLYLPPPNVGYAQVFFDHLQRYKRANELILYSEHPWPGAIMLKGNPESFRNTRTREGAPSKFAIANATFVAGLRIAWLNHYTHVILIEPDVRFARHYWDQEIFNEYFDLGFPAIAAGTLVCFNMCNYSPLAAARWADLVKSNPRRNFPIVSYGWLGGGVKGQSIVFPNGALAVYDVAWMHKLFGLDSVNYHEVAQDTAWDQLIGLRIWDIFKDDSYLVVGHLNCIFSGYGNVVTEPEQRRALLTSGEICAMHQEKENWVPEKL